MWRLSLYNFMRSKLHIGGKDENKSKRIAYRRQNDITTVGRFGSCIIKNYHFY